MLKYKLRIPTKALHGLNRTSWLFNNRVSSNWSSLPLTTRLNDFVMSQTPYFTAGYNDWKDNFLKRSYLDLWSDSNSFPFDSVTYWVATIYVTHDDAWTDREAVWLRAAEFTKSDALLMAKGGADMLNELYFWLQNEAHQLDLLEGVDCNSWLQITTYSYVADQDGVDVRTFSSIPYSDERKILLTDDTIAMQSWKPYSLPDDGSFATPGVPLVLTKGEVAHPDRPLESMGVDESILFTNCADWSMPMLYWLSCGKFQAARRYVNNVWELTYGCLVFGYEHAESDKFIWIRAIDFINGTERNKDLFKRGDLSYLTKSGKVYQTPINSSSSIRERVGIFNPYCGREDKAVIKLSDLANRKINNEERVKEFELINEILNSNQAEGFFDKAKTAVANFFLDQSDDEVPGSDIEPSEGPVVDK